MSRVIEQFAAGIHRDRHGLLVWSPSQDIQYAKSDLIFLGYIRKDRLKDNTREAYPVTQLGEVVLNEWQNPTPQPEKLIGLGGRSSK